MLKDHEDKAAFLREQLNFPYIEKSPITGNPRFSLDANAVWQAIEEYGGLPKVCHDFKVSGIEIHSWIDNHWVPVNIAYKIAIQLGIKDISIILAPETGYFDEKANEYWPLSWNPTLVQ